MENLGATLEEIMKNQISDPILTCLVQISHQQIFSVGFTSNSG